MFENLIVMEALKHRLNRGLRSNLHFYRDSSGLEVDLLASFADRLVGIEIKAGATVSGGFFRALRKLSGLLPRPLDGQILVHGGDGEHTQEGVRVTNPRGFVGQLAGVEATLDAKAGPH